MANRRTLRVTALVMASLAMSGAVRSQHEAAFRVVRPRAAAPRVVALKSPALQTRPADLARDQLWQECVALRQRLGLPAKARFVGSYSRYERRRFAMAELTAAQRVALRAKADIGRLRNWPDQRAACARRRDEQVLQHFRAALATDPGSAEALLSLASTATDPVLARLAIVAVGPREVLHMTLRAASPRVLERAATHLSLLLDCEDVSIAGLAWCKLQWLLDAAAPRTGSPPRTEALRVLVDRAATCWPKKPAVVQCGPWNAKHCTAPLPESVLAFPPPSDPLSRLFAFAGMTGDADRIDRISKDGYDSRVVLHCHSLVAHRVDAAKAQQLFGWYSRHPPRWPERDATDINAWEWGVIATLVGVLPKLPAKYLDFYGEHLFLGRIGAAAQVVARHRLQRLARLPERAWLDLAQVDLKLFEPSDALRLWRALASQEQWTLAGCVAAAPLAKGSGCRAKFLCEVLACAPTAAREENAAAEVALLRALWLGDDHAIARASLGCLVRRSDTGHRLATAWLQQAAAAAAERRALAFELAIDLRVPLAAISMAGSDPLQRLLQGLHAAVIAASSEQSEAALRVAINLGVAPELELGKRLAILHAARHHPAWWPEVAQFVATNTTHGDAPVRRAAYRALASAGAASLPHSQLAGEAVYDAAVLVRRISSPHR